MNDSDAYVIKCTQCGTKNRIPKSKSNAIGKCGKCKRDITMRDQLDGRAPMITDRDFQQKVLEVPLPVLMFCWAPWCPTCQAEMPVMDQIAMELRGRARIVKVNVDQCPLIANRFQVRGVPFLFIFEQGQLRESFPGGVPKMEITNRLAKYLY